MIEKLEKRTMGSFDFLQDSVNDRLVDKINEIIDYINQKEKGDK